MSFQLSKFVVFGLSLTLGACGNFIGLKENIDHIEQGYISVSGVVTNDDCPDCAIIIAVLSPSDNDTQTIDAQHSVCHLLIDQP